MDLVIEHIGGYCPVQAEGTINGIPFYFRSRHKHWAIGIGDDPAGIILGWTEGWCRKEEYLGASPDIPSAGYMPLEEARQIIQRCAEEFVAEKA